MNDELLPYYDRELAFIRHMGAEFAANYPKIAGRLYLDPRSGETTDPHVERILEGFAYLNARTRYKLDDDFPELAEAMLGVLYPHYLAPIPSMAIVQLALDRGQGELTSGYDVPRGTMFEADTPDGDPCRFQTTYPATLWPIEVVSASLSGPPFTPAPAAYAAQAKGLLRLELKCWNKDLSFEKLQSPSLRFFLKGQGQHVFPLYELLFTRVLGVVLAGAPRDPQPVLLDRQCLQPVGFGREEGMFPYPLRSFLGYRLLTEYFAFPQKFLFFDLTGLSPASLRTIGNTLEIRIYLDQSIADLEQNLTADMFRLGCAPIVNLFPQRAEPIALTHTETEYRVAPDARHPWAYEIYSVDKVAATSPNNEQIEYQPFYSFKHAADRQKEKTFWHATRRPSGLAGGKNQGPDVYLSLVDMDFSPSAPPGWTVMVETTCLDGDRPRRFFSGEGQGAFRLAQGSPVSRVECLTPPTAVFRPPRRHGALWRLISHLSLNHLSVTDEEDGAHALREILKLYDYANSAETQAMVEGVLSVRSRRVVGRGGAPRAGICRGLQVTIQFDEGRFVGSGLYLFAAVLERFLGLYCSINSFSKMIATTTKGGEPWRWPPRAAETVLL